MLTWSQVSAFRLTRHHFVDRGPAPLATVTRDVCGIQAQVMSAAHMALWARMHHLTRRDLHSALWKSRTLVKTSCMRGTLHLLAAPDLPLYISALRSSRIRAMRKIQARDGRVSEKEGDAVMHAVAETLHSGPMTRGDLTERILSLNILGKKAKKWFELGWWGVVRQAIVEGLICYGPDRGPEVTFVRVDQWLPKQKQLGEQQAKQLLLRRYLRAYGPATPRDFAKWTGMSMPEVRPIWESVRGELLEVSIEDSKGWLLREDCKQLSKCDLGEPVLRLLPNFDPYMLAHVQKHHLVDRPYYKRVYRNAGWISPVVLLDGKSIGTWSLTHRGKDSYLNVQLFAKTAKIFRARIEQEAASLARFLESSLHVSLL